MTKIDRNKLNKLEKKYGVKLEQIGKMRVSVNDKYTVYWENDLKTWIAIKNESENFFEDLVRMTPYLGNALKVIVRESAGLHQVA